MNTFILLKVGTHMIGLVKLIARHSAMKLEKNGTSLVKLVLSRRNPGYYRAAIRPSYLFRYSRQNQRDLAVAGSGWFYAPLMPCVTRRTDTQGLARPYSTGYLVKYHFFAQILALFELDTVLKFKQNHSLYRIKK
jgi:hypothetical protein